MPKPLPNVLNDVQVGDDDEADGEQEQDTEERNDITTDE
jgi:hypothetical protein